MHQRTLTPENLRIDEQRGERSFSAAPFGENSGKRSKIPGLKGERIA